MLISFHTSASMKVHTDWLVLECSQPSVCKAIAMAAGVVACLLAVLWSAQTMWEFAMFTMMSYTSTAFAMTWTFLWTGTLEVVCFTYG